MSSSHTLFDTILGHTQFDEAETYILLSLLESDPTLPNSPPARRSSAAAVSFGGLNDAFLLGRLLGHTLHRRFEPGATDAFLVALIAGATTALQEPDTNHDASSAG